MAGLISTGSNPKMLWEGINKIWGAAYQEHIEEFSLLFDMDMSEKSFEEDVEQVGLGLASVKPQGQAINYDSMRQGVVDVYQHIAYASGYIVTYEERKDNLYVKAVRKRTRELAFGMRQTVEHVAANVYGRGFDTDFTFANGEPLFSTTHPTDAGSQANRPTGGAQLSEQALEDQVISINTMKNARGHKIKVQPVQLIIAPHNEFTAARILKSVLQNDNANNAINAIRAMNSIPKGATVNHYLPDANAWFIRTDIRDAFRGFWRDRAFMFEDNDGDTMNRKYAAYQRLSFGRSDFRGCWGVPGP
jgi:hypothetical protein